MSTKLRIASKDAQDIIKTIKDAIKAAGVKPKHIPYEDEVKDDEKTGNVLLKHKAYGKTKDEDTTDLLITGAVEGEGKHVGRLGAINTRLGEIGTGFSDEERAELWAEHLAGTLVGQTVECSYMHLTEDGQMRHSRFERMRPDKVADL